MVILYTTDCTAASAARDRVLTLSARDLYIVRNLLEIASGPRVWATGLTTGGVPVWADSDDPAFDAYRDTEKHVREEVRKVAREAYFRQATITSPFAGWYVLNTPVVPTGRVRFITAIGAWNANRATMFEFGLVVDEINRSLVSVSTTATGVYATFSGVLVLAPGNRAMVAVLCSAGDSIGYRVVGYDEVESS